MDKNIRKYNVAVVGATGLVGRTFLEVLEEYDFHIVKTDIYNIKFSKIYIKARSKDIFNIYSSFCKRLQDNITNSGFEKEIIF